MIGGVGSEIDRFAQVGEARAGAWRDWSAAEHHHPAWEAMVGVSKTDQLGVGREVGVPHGRGATDSVRAVQEWVAAARRRAPSGNQSDAY
jgi:hypothetical protein